MKILAYISFLFLLGCSHNPLAQIPDEFKRHELNAGMFRVLSLQKHKDSRQPWVIYIEGDGYAWINRITPSPDPTPHYPIAWRLAQLDPSPNVAYLARPCQYITDDPACHETYWTDRRFSYEIMDAMNEALSQITKGQPMRLVAYSGGAVIAVILTARRGDVLNLRTVAGNLDAHNFNRFHKVSQTPHALDPYDYAYAIRHISQIHYIGTEDEIVPPDLARFFLYAMKNPPSATIWPVSGATHYKRWEDEWPSLVTCFMRGAGPSSCPDN